MDIHITVDIPNEKPQRISPCIQIFEDYCVVIASIKKGIEVNVLVMDSKGNKLVELYER